MVNSAISQPALIRFEEKILKTEARKTSRDAGEKIK